MNDKPNQTSTINDNNYSKKTKWNERDRDIINVGDVRRPWKSVYAFPTTAARLAAGQEMLLHCRQDEVDELMTGLNDLLKSPENLYRAGEMLKLVHQVTQQKLNRLIHIHNHPIADDELSELFSDVENALNEMRNVQTAVSRLAGTLSPDNPTREIAGTCKMMLRLQKQIAAITQVRHKGVHVLVRDKRRLLLRPDLEANQNKPENGANNGNVSSVKAYLPKYHLTLWTYLVSAKNEGESVPFA